MNLTAKLHPRTKTFLSAGLLGISLITAIVSWKIIRKQFFQKRKMAEAEKNANFIYELQKKQNMGNLDPNIEIK